MMGVVQTGTNEGRGRAGVMVPVPGFSMYQARLLQHNSYQVNEVNLVKKKKKIFLTCGLHNPFQIFEWICSQISDVKVAKTR